MDKSLSAICLQLALSGLLRATTIYVATNGVDTRTGTDDWTNAVLTISNGVAKATAVNDTVLVSNGQYLLTTKITVGSQITVRSWNNGAEDPTNTIVNGQASVQCFYLNHTGAVAEGFTVYNGKPSADNGGGVKIAAGTLRNCIVVSNSAQNYSGGGIYFEGAKTGLVDNCVMAYNFATNGGGIDFYPYSGGTMLVTNCVIRNNSAVGTAGNAGGGGVWMKGNNAVLADCRIYGNDSAYHGGGITIDYVASANTLVKDCVISNNYVFAASGSGGGILMYGVGLVTNCVIISNVCGGQAGGIYLYAAPAATLADCRIIGNRSTNTASAYLGGGVYVQSGSILNSEIRDNYGGTYGGGVMIQGDDTAAMRNCLIVGNTATNGGGGVGVRYGQSKVVLENCTIVSNRVSPGASGGGINLAGNGTNFFANSIIYFNTVSSGAYSNYYHSGAAVIGSYSNCALAPALSDASTNYSANNITADPLFLERASGNYRLTRESPCVNAGANRPWMTGAADLDSHRRLDTFSGVVDIGCYEYMPSGMMCNVK